MLLKKLAHLRFASDVLDRSITLNWLLPPFVLYVKKACAAKQLTEDSTPSHEVKKKPKHKEKN
jgi:hypothetical protein